MAQLEGGCLLSAISFKYKYECKLKHKWKYKYKLSELRMEILNMCSRQLLSKANIGLEGQQLLGNWLSVEMDLQECHDNKEVSHQIGPGHWTRVGCFLLTPPPF